MKAAPRCFSNRTIALGQSEAGGRHGCYQGAGANPAADMFVFLLHLGHRPWGWWCACLTYVLLRHFVIWRHRRVGVGGAFLCCTGCLPPRRGRVFRVLGFFCGVCGREVFADVVWRVCGGLHRILDSWLRCVTRASPASWVFGYPAWFTDMSRGGVRQTTVDGLPRVIKFGREAFVDVVWKGCLRGCIVSGTLGCGA